MGSSQDFWNKNAERYDRFMRKDAAAYERLYELIRPVVRQKTVLELATGTGLIAKNIVNDASHIEATDASPEMIADFKACGGFLLLATGFRIAKIHNFPVADMIPAMVLVMPVSWFWGNVVVPML